MRRIRIILLRRDRDRAVALLQKLGTVDFRKSALNLPDDEGTDYYEVLPRLLSLVGGAVAALPKRPVYRMRHMEREKLIRAAGKEMDAIGRIQELDSDRKELEDKIGEAELKGDEDPKGYKVELKGIANELDEISSKHYSRLSCLKEMLEIETARAEAFLMFKRTKDTC
ncbi:MAG: hypothetical protein KGH50_03255, partial [Candidatus Micrarchaeota archaeon]|nr:hypothetical protein [Candidatus Micrarchaeota archaeon]